MKNWRKKRQKKGKSRNRADRRMNKEIKERETFITKEVIERCAPKKVREPKVSDHAVVRYLERFMGIDVDEIRCKILTPTVKGAIEAGAKTFISEGITYCIKNNVITTVHNNKAGLEHKYRENLK